MGKEDGKWVRLLRNERWKIAGLHAFLSPGLESCFSTDNMEKVRKMVHDRANAIARTNPWLCGRIRTHPIGRCTALWVPRALNTTQFYSEIPVTVLEDALPEAKVGTGYEILNCDEPPVKLRFIYNDHHFLLTICCSHIIGEPNLLYQIWSMLSPTSEIVKLEVRRQHWYRIHPLTAIRGKGRRKFLYFFFRSEASPLYSLIHGHTHKGGKVHTYRRLVNMDWVKQEKERYLKNRAPDDPLYVSTQDVLTVWFFGQLHTSCVGLAYDMRYRIKGLTSKDTGNYLDALILYPYEYKNPANIRLAVESVGRKAPRVNRPGDHPDRDYNKADRSVGTVTGWHSRHVDLELPGCERHTHLPLRGTMYTGDIPRTLPCMCIFKVHANQFAVLALSRTELVDMSALGDEVEV